MDELPTDIILLIFSKLQVKILQGLKCVCKSWSRIIEGPNLAKIHLNGGIEEPRILLFSKSDITPDNSYVNNWKGDHESILEISSKLLSKNTKPEAYTLESCCNGILCFRKKYGLDRTAYLLNPFRQEALELPAPKSLSQLGLAISYGLGFDSTTSEYKIIRVVSRRRETPDQVDLQDFYFNSTCEIYTLGMSSSWRALSSGPPCPVFGRSVFARGILYWVGLPELMNMDHSNDIHGKIVTFHVSKEEFRLISCPGQFFCFSLVDLKGVMGVVDWSSSTHIEIWTMRDHDRQNWVEEYRIEIRAPDNIQVIGLWKNGELLLKYCQSFISCNPKNDSPKYIQIPSCNFDTEVCSFTGSFVSLSSFKAS